MKISRRIQNTQNKIKSDDTKGLNRTEMKNDVKTRLQAVR